RAGDVLIREIADADTVGCAAQQIERRLLARAETWAAFGLLVPLRRQHRHADPARGIGEPSQRTRQRDQPVLRERQQRTVRAARFLRERLERYDASSRELLEDVASQPALG